MAVETGLARPIKRCALIGKSRGAPSARGPTAPPPLWGEVAAPDLVRGCRRGLAEAARHLTLSAHWPRACSRAAAWCWMLTEVAPVTLGMNRRGALTVLGGVSIGAAAATAQLGGGPDNRRKLGYAIV